MEQLDYTLLFRWFVGLDLDASVWDGTVFTKNWDRLLDGDVATAFFEHVLAQAQAHRLLSDEHFTGDSTLIEARAGQKSFKQKTDATPVPPPEDPAIPVTSGASGGPMPRTPRRPIRRPGRTRRRRAKRPSCVSWAMS